MPHYRVIYIYQGGKVVEKLSFYSEKRFKKVYDRLKKENIFFSVVTLFTEQERQAKEENIKLIEDRSREK